MVTAYCTKCKKDVEIKNPKEVPLKNIGRMGTMGLCPQCGSKILRVGEPPTGTSV